MSKSRKKQKGRYSVKNIKALVANGWWAAKLMYSFNKMDTIIIGLTIVTSSVLPTLSAYSFALLLDEVVSAITSEGYVLEFIISNRIIQFSLLYAGTKLVYNIINGLRIYYNEKFWVVYSKQIEKILNLKISSLDISMFEDPKMSDVVKKAKDNIWKLNDFINVGMTFIRFAIQFIISALLLFSISPLLAIFLLISSIPTGLIQGLFIKELWEFIDASREIARKRHSVLGSMNDSKMIYENRISKSISFLLTKLISFDKVLINGELGYRKRKFQRDFISLALNTIKLVTLPIFFVIKILNGQFSIAQFSFYFQKGIDFSNDFEYMMLELIDILDSAIAISSLREILEKENDVKSGNKRLKQDSPPKIEFKNVSFKYPRTSRYILRNISLIIYPGQEIALVGENGAGKTTMIKLLLRFYDVSKGEILLNNIPIQAYNLQSLYNVFSALFQDYNIYQFASIAENITFKQKSSKKLKKALKLTNANDFVSKLPYKEETLMSTSFTKGLNLSKGQEQKIAISRVFTNDAPILILDEPTASIDAVAEHNIFKRIYDFMTDKTVIIISHRFSTVRNAQKIYVLDKGKIVEEGSHEELLKIDGKYAEAFNLQAEGYIKGNSKSN